MTDRKSFFTLKTYLLTPFWPIIYRFIHVLDHFHNFSILTETRNAPIKVFSSSHMISNARNRFLDPENLWFDTILTSLDGILTVLGTFNTFDIMADTHNAPIKVFSSSHMKSDVRDRFLDLENICFDTTLTSLDGILTVLDNFNSFGIMADTHNVPIMVFYSSYMISDTMNGFLDPENLCFDTTLATLGAKMTILC